MVSLPNSLIQSALEAADRLARQLAATQTKIVFAESCTAGLASALLAHVPGISGWHCGSAVTYREATKTAWLGVSPEDLAEFTAVSEPVARQMASGVLEKTPEANLAVSITGHLGPNAPQSFDGLAFVATARRTTAEDSARVEVPTCHRLQLASGGRIARAWEAATAVLRVAKQSIDDQIR